MTLIDHRSGCRVGMVTLLIASIGGCIQLDPELIKRDIVAAGFLFGGESDVLRNFTDDHSQPVFDNSIRGRTDRAVLKFRKPVTL